MKKKKPRKIPKWAKKSTIAEDKLMKEFKRRLRSVKYKALSPDEVQKLLAKAKETISGDLELVRAGCNVMCTKCNKRYKPADNILCVTTEREISTHCLTCGTQSTLMPMTI